MIFRKKYIEFPTSWEELTPKQFEKIIKLHWLSMLGKIEKFDILILFTKYVLKIKSIAAFFPWNTIKLSQLYRVAITLDWIYTLKYFEGVEFSVLNFKGLTNYFPKIKNRYAPVSVMEMTFDEYRMAFECYVKYINTHDLKLLNKLYAILYLPKTKQNTKSVNYDGRFRESFNANLTEMYVAQTKRVPMHLKYAAFLWFGNWDEYMKSGDIEVDGTVLNLGELFKNSGSEAGLGFTGWLFSLADEGTFGDIAKVDKTAIIDILLKIYNDNEKLKHMKSHETV